MNSHDTEQILESLSDAQRAAASYLDGPLIIIAGPGSGKTRVMSHRMAYILASGVSPWRALGVTFTNKAAAELKQRCERLVSTFVPNVRDTNVSTFHSFGARFLRIHSDAAGLEQGFTIYDRDDQTRLLKLILQQMDADEKVNELLDAITRAKNNNQSPDDFASVSTSYKWERHAEIYEQYEAGLRAANAVDFDDLLLKPYRLLVSDDDIRHQYQERFLHIMVDEFQDTNSLQFELVRLLGDHHKNVCVVGDPDQSIYSWRNARPENMGLLTEVMAGCKVFHLSESYRSTKTVIAAADALIANNDRRFERTLFTNNDTGDPIEIATVNHPEHEAEIVLDTIEKYRDTVSNGAVSSNGTGRKSLDDFAVLYRTNAQSRAIETECSARGIKYRLVGGVRFYERREIKDALAMLRIIVNSSDETSLRRIINVPPRGIGPATLQSIEEYSHFNGISLLKAVLLSTDPVMSGVLGLGPSALNKVRSFAEFIITLSQNSEKFYPHDLLDYTLKSSGYLEWIRKDEETRLERTENLRELSNLAQQYSDDSQGATPSQSLMDLLEHTALFSNVDDMETGIATDSESVSQATSGGGAVTLITLHQAKGLEFDTVFIVGVCEGLLPHAMALNVDNQEEYEANSGEERRLMYVGMTRAKKALHISHPLLRGSSPYNSSQNAPSRFLDEIPDKYIKKVNYSTVPQGGPPKPVTFANNGSPYIDVRPRPTIPRPKRKFTEEDIEKVPSEIRFKAGERVKHHQFGTGVVVNARPVGDDLRVTVAFSNAGIKTLMSSMAHLERI